MRTLLNTRYIALALTTSLFAVGCATVSEAKEAGSASATTPLSEAEAAQRMTDAATPRAQHAWLLEDAGRWKGTSTSWPSSGAEPYVSPAEFVVRPVLSGRFCETTHRCEMPDMPAFEAMVLTGYDNAAREFQTLWIDSFGTTMMTGTGARSADGATLSITCSYFCPMRGRRTTLWQSITRESANRQTHRMWAEEMATGTKYLMAESVYERQPS